MENLSIENLLENYFSKNEPSINYKSTGKRVKKVYDELTSGYAQDIDLLVNGAIYQAPSENMIVIDNINFSSLCEHHLLPFYGCVKVGYIPNQKIIGLSKIPRIVEMYSKRLQLQEKLSKEIAEEIDRILNPKGLAIRIKAQHLCTVLRGVKNYSTEMITVFYTGIFKKDQNLQNQFLEIK